MQVDLKGQVALVTGASRGIGRCISLALARAGTHVILTARNVERLQRVEKEVLKAGGRATVAPADISQENEVHALFDLVKDRVKKLDILVNNAAIGLYGDLVDFSMEDFDRIMQLNVRGLYLCCQKAMKIMVPLKHGYIINLSSVVGFKGYPNQSAYTASKHAIMGITKSLAVEAQKHNIHVAAIQPGAVETDLAFEARPDLDPSILIKPEDIASCVVFLLSLSERAWIDQIYVRRRNGTPFIGM
jgi:3-oxoacyl-[acyl-carrier protein] reductase